MLRRALMAGLVLAPMIFTACEDNDASGPQGTNAAVTVNAYVDANGNGSLDAADVGINNSSITLTGQDGTTYTATTNASGAATFEAVKPGSYTVSRTGTTPDGAVLATASSPVLVVPFQGGTLSSEFRYVFNPGSVSGQLFRDNNSNGAFDAGDTPAPGMSVLLFMGTDTLATPLATTTTDNNGVFTFNTLRPGNYTVKISAIPTITIVGGTTQAVTVGANAVTAVPVKFTGNLIGTVAGARAAAEGATVAFEGIATVNQGAFASPSGSSQQIFVQDGTAGILVFGLPATAGIAAGDSVRVIGTKVTFSSSGEVEVTIAGAGQGVTKLASVTVPPAKVITEAQAVALEHMGELVTIPNLLVRNVAKASSTGAYNVGVGGPAAADTFTIRVASSNTGIDTLAFVVGQRYDVTGDMSVFKGIANLKPRSLSDIVKRSSALSIAEARQHPAKDTVTVEGVVYVGTDVLTASNAANRTAYIMDRNGDGLLLFGVPAGTTLVNGDSIRAKGVVSFFSNEFELTKLPSSPMVIEKLGTSAIREPLVITGKALASGDFDGSLVKIFGARIDSLPGTVSGTGGFNVDVTSSDGVRVRVRVDNVNTGLTQANFAIGSRIDIVGAALNFGSTTLTPEIKPRSTADITPSTLPTNLKTIAEARAIAASATPDTVTVLGIVTAGRGTFRTDNAYIFDGTGGMQIFNLPASLSLNVGDAVLVHGKAVSFAPDVEIANNGSGDSIRVTKIGTNTAVDAESVTGAQLLGRQNESQLVRVEDVTVTSVGTQATAGKTSYTVKGNAPDGTEITIFMSAPTGAVPSPIGFITVGGHYDFTGIEVPFTTGGTTIGELKPRGAFDVVQR